MSGIKRRLLLNRLRPLQRSNQVVLRNELLLRLQSNEDAHLTIIHGPAGSGKTSLLIQHYENLHALDRHCGWLSIDPPIQDSVQLLAHVFASLDTSSFLPQELVDAAFNGFHGLDETEALGLVVNSLGDIEEPVYLLIDDVHLLKSPIARQSIQSLLELTNKNIRFVITSRESPATLRNRARVAGSLHEVSVADLAFSEVEARELLSLPSTGDASDSLARAIFRKTEGWPAALEFAARWAEQQPSIDLSEFVNQSADFVSFLMTEVFDQLPRALQEVMLLTAPLNSFNGDLVNYVCERNDGWTVIDELVNRNLLIANDHTNSYFRYNNLFNDFLQDRFEKEAPRPIVSIHERAAEWHTEHSNSADALRHAVESGVPELVLAAVEQAGGWHMVLDGRISTIRSALLGLDEGVIRRYPMTYLGYLMLMAKSGEITKATTLYNEFSQEHHKLRKSFDQIVGRDYELETKIVGFFISIMGDQPNTPLRIGEMEDVLARLNKDDNFLRANVTNYLCYAYFDNRDYRKAYRTGETAIMHYRALRSLYGENFMYFHLGKICLAQGRLRDAEQLYHQGEQLANQNFGDDNNMVSIASAHLAELNLEKSDVEATQRHLDIAFPRIENFDSWFDTHLSAYFSASAIAQADKNFVLATKILRRAGHIGRDRGLRRLRLFALCRYARMLAQQSKLSRSKWVIDTLHLRQLLEEKQFVNPRVAEEVSITLGYYKLRSGQPRETVAIVTKCISAAANSGSRRSLIDLNILLALSYHKLDRHRPSISALDKALVHSIFESFKRPFMQYGAELLPLLDLAISGPCDPPLNRMKRTFLTGIATAITKENTSGVLKPRGPLSRREREIVRYVSEGYSNKEIAMNCNCSADTVKYHLKKIFVKLEVKNRKDLARVAWEDGHCM